MRTGRPKVASRAFKRLRCLRGMDDLTALLIAAELGDSRRFATAPGWADKPGARLELNRTTNNPAH